MDNLRWVSSEAKDQDYPDVHFVNPPVVEVVLGVQFRPILGLRPIALAPLRERWQANYPIAQEQPPLPPVTEEAWTAASSIRLTVGPALQTRLWFLSSDESELVQLQHDRLTVNWRESPAGGPYPRYPRVRAQFIERFRELHAFVVEKELGDLTITQAEVDYVNAVELPSDQLGHLQQLFRHWEPMTNHHLGNPEQARIALVFSVPGVGRGPVRMYVKAEPAQRPDGEPFVLLNLTFRGAPADESIEEAIRFMDGAHSHLVRSFLEMTPETAQFDWGLQR